MAEQEVHQIKESRVLAAMSHPLRRRLLDLLKVDGPATASMLAERSGQAVGNISHHLRVLAGCELVVEVPELARDRRERWWRRTAASVSWSPKDFRDSPANEAVADAAESLNLDHQVNLVRAWFATRESYDESWHQRGPFSTETWLRLTAAELEELYEQLAAVFAQWSAREEPDDGQQREPVFVFSRGVPGRP